MKKEIWKEVPNYDGDYLVSTLGRVKSLKLRQERILKPSPNTQGYLVVSLVMGGAQKTYKIHKLVASAFLNHKPCGLLEVVDHVNNIRTDNRLENLQLMTSRENTNKVPRGKSKYTGVFWCNSSNKFLSRITVNKKVTYLGAFNNEIDAYSAYKNALTQVNNEKLRIDTDPIINELKNQITQLTKENQDLKTASSVSTELYNALSCGYSEIELKLQAAEDRINELENGR